MWERGGGGGDSMFRGIFHGLGLPPFLVGYLYKVEGEFPRDGISPETLDIHLVCCDINKL